jgi:hypothetical protein
MTIGGYSMKDDGVYGIVVEQYEAGWSFFLQGDDAETFRKEWEFWQEHRPEEPFGQFLNDHEYKELFQ